MRQCFSYLDRIEFVDERFYKYVNTENGEELYYPSVTHILQSFPMDYGLLQWNRDVGNNAPEIANRAANSGSKVHNTVSALINGHDVIWDDKIYNEEEWKGLINFYNFFKLHNPITMYNEKIVFDHDFKFAGTIDWLCKIGEEIWLIDFKFSNAIHKSYMLQLAAYKKCLEKELNIKINKIGILHLKSKKKQGWDLVEPEHDSEFLFEIFLKVRDLHIFTNPDQKPKNLVYQNRITLKEEA